MPDRLTVEALVAAARRGVRVRIVVPGRYTDARVGRWAAQALYHDLLDVGVELYEYQPTMIHAKATVVDGKWSIIGSANFDNRSLDMNDEMNIGVFDPSLATALTVAFEDDLRSAKRLTLEEWRRRALHEKANEKFWSLFGEFF